MNYYPHHLGDYSKDTLGFSALEHGVYHLLLDAYYASETPPPADEVYAIAKAGTRVERKAVDKVLKKFELRDGHYFHKRVEQELAAYRARSDDAAKKANARWEKERAKKAAAAMLEHVPQQEPQYSPGISLGSTGAMLASNQEPESTTTAFPVMDTSGPAPPAAGGSETTPDPTRMASITALCQRAKVEGATASSPEIAAWIAKGATVGQVERALTEARAHGSKPFPASLLFGYVTVILERLQRVDRAAREASDAKVERTQAQVAEQRTWVSTPKPENFPVIRKAAGA